MPRVAGFPTTATVLLDGAPHAARDGEPLAAALLAGGVTVLGRSAKYHRARGAFCLQGSCGGCLLRIDGRPSRRACRIPCREGLSGQTQNAFPDARRDLLALVDLATPRGLDHHRLGTSSLVATRIAVALSRRLSGVGLLPDRRAPPPALPAPAEESFDALVVGAGPAGLAAAEALAEAGRRVLVADGAPGIGGRLRARLTVPPEPELAWAARIAARVHAAGGELATRAEVAGLWHDGGAPLALLQGEAAPGKGHGLRLVRPGVIVLCPGGHPVPPAIPGGDLPGVLAARGAATLLAEHGVLPGLRIALLAGEPEAGALVRAFVAAGAEVVTVASADGGHLVGRTRVRALRLPGRRIPCDALLAGGPPAPALELARALGAPVRWDAALGAPALAVGPRGETGVERLLAAGEVTGAMSATAAAEAGRRAGEAARG